MLSRALAHAQTRFPTANNIARKMVRTVSSFALGVVFTIVVTFLVHRILTDDAITPRLLQRATLGDYPFCNCFRRDGQFDMIFKTPIFAKTIHASGPYRVLLNNGKMLVSERHGNFVSVRDMNGKLIKKYGSPSENGGKMTKPAGMAFDSDGSLYVTSDHKLQKYLPDGTLIAEVGGSEPGDMFNRPYSVAVKDDRIYVCDAINDRIQVFDIRLNLLDDMCITDIGMPQDIAFDSGGNMYVSSKSDHRIFVFNERGDKIHEIGSDGGVNKLREPTGFHLYGDYILVSDEGGNGIKIYNLNGQFVTSFGLGLKQPRGVTSDDNGQIYICEYEGDRIVVL